MIPGCLFRREDWAIPDPQHMDTEQFRQVRDFIAPNVKRVLEELAHS